MVAHLIDSETFVRIAAERAETERFRLTQAGKPELAAELSAALRNVANDVRMQAEAADLPD